MAIVMTNTGCRCPTNRVVCRSNLIDFIYVSDVIRFLTVEILYKCKKVQMAMTSPMTTISIITTQTLLCIRPTKPHYRLCLFVSLSCMGS